MALHGVSSMGSSLLMIEFLRMCTCIAIFGHPGPILWLYVLIVGIFGRVVLLLVIGQYRVVMRAHVMNNCHLYSII